MTPSVLSVTASLCSTDKRGHSGPNASSTSAASSRRGWEIMFEITEWASLAAESWSWPETGAIFTIRCRRDPSSAPCMLTQIRANVRYHAVHFAHSRCQTDASYGALVAKPTCQPDSDQSPVLTYGICQSGIIPSRRVPWCETLNPWQTPRNTNIHPLEHRLASCHPPPVSASSPSSPLHSLTRRSSPSGFSLENGEGAVSEIVAAKTSGPHRIMQASLSPGGGGDGRCPLVPVRS